MFDKQKEQASKAFGAAVAIQNYEIYLSGVEAGRNLAQYPSLKEFCQSIAPICERGKKLSMQVKRFGERNHAANAAQEGD